MAKSAFNFTFIPPQIRVTQHLILDLIATTLNQATQRAVGQIKNDVGEIAADAIRSGEAYLSLLNGKLRNELGVVDARPVLEQVIQKVIDGMQVTTPFEVRRIGDRIEGGILIEILTVTMEEIGVPGGSFTSENGHNVDWLNWLTRGGDRIMVLDHRFLGIDTKYSRTGRGIMVKPGSWKVPAEYSGTIDDNWLTRAVLSKVPEMGDAVAKAIVGVF